MRKQQLLIAGIVLLSLATVLVVLSVQHQPATSWTMPDGSRMRLVKVTYGTNNTCVLGNRLLDLIYPYVPAKFRTNFNFKVVSALSGKTPTLALWLERTGVPPNSISATTTLRSSGTSSGISLISGLAPYRFSVFDSHGLESRPLTPRRYGFASNSSELVEVTLSQYPAQAKTLGIRVYPANTEPLAEFHVPNRPPPPVYPPGWVAEPLPATRQTNGLEVTLEKVETGLPITIGAVTGHRLKSYSRLTFTVKEGGQPARGWVVKRFSESNAPNRTNSISSTVNTLYQSTFTITSPLWLDDPAWKITMELARVKDFPARDVWTIDGLPIPKDGETLDLNSSTNLQVGKVTLTKVYDTERFGGAVPDRVSLDFQLDGDVSASVISITDNQGRTLTPLLGVSTQINGSNKTIAFYRPDGAKTLTVSLGISRNVAVEFIVKPELAGPSALPDLPGLP